MKIESFSKSYAGQQALCFPGGELVKGKVYAVIGANGSGKSTFAKILSGVVKSDDGIQALDKSIAVGYMPQKSYGFHMSVLNSLLINSHNRDKDRLKATALMEKMNMTMFQRKKANRLSGGETAKTAMMRLFMNRYDILILDEPTAAMDVKSVNSAERVLDEYRLENKCAVLFITHSIKQAERVSDETMFFSEGKLIEWSDTKKLLHSPEHALTRQFIEFCGT